MMETSTCWKWKSIAFYIINIKQRYSRTSKCELLGYCAESGRAFLNKRFKLEEKSQLKEPKDADFLVAFIKEIFESMAMVDYPYPTSFLTPLPGWPVKVSLD